MRIVLVCDCYSEGMGYTENCLPKALAALGHEVHVVTSKLNAYGNAADYAKIYGRFFGPAEQPCGEREIDGYRLHRLPSSLVGHYVRIHGLVEKVASLSPNIVQSTPVAGINLFRLALARRRFSGRLFSECHQHMSVVPEYLKTGRRMTLKRMVYFATRTLPGRLASRSVEKCYAISPDCAEVAHRYYGVPRKKIFLAPLGTDTERFHPAQTQGDRAARLTMRRRLGFADHDIVCIYSGRLSEAKKPLVLARAVAQLRSEGLDFRGLFVGEGEHKSQIEGCQGCVTAGFVAHRDLAAYYRAADVAVWPAQESMSMLDAAACGLPLVVCDRMGDLGRVEGNGLLYREGDVADMAAVLSRFQDEQYRRRLGDAASRKMLASWSWMSIAERRIADYLEDPAGHAPNASSSGSLTSQRVRGLAAKRQHAA